MGVERRSGGARGGRTVCKEPLDGEVVIRLKAWGDVEGCDVLSRKGDFDLRGGSGSEGGLGSH